MQFWAEKDFVGGVWTTLALIDLLDNIGNLKNYLKNNFKKSELSARSYL